MGGRGRRKRREDYFSPKWHFLYKVLSPLFIFFLLLKNFSVLLVADLILAMHRVLRTTGYDPEAKKNFLGREMGRQSESMQKSLFCTHKIEFSHPHCEDLAPKQTSYVLGLPYFRENKTINRAGHHQTSWNMVVTFGIF